MLQLIIDAEENGIPKTDRELEFTVTDSSVLQKQEINFTVKDHSFR